MDKRISTIIFIPILLFLASFYISYYSAYKMYHLQPTTTDENSYVFEAKLLLKGKFFSTPHTLKDFFWTEQIVADNKWFSRYAPGHALVLLPGVLINFKNLMPIVLSSLTIVIIFLFLLKLTKNIIISTIAGIVAILSPYFIAMSGTCLSHTSCTFFIALYLFIFYKNIEDSLKNNSLSLLSGFILSFAFIIRQYTTVFITTPFVLYHFYLCIKNKKYKNFLFFIIGTIPLIILLLFYNYKCTGNPLLQTYSYYAPSEKPGFGLRLDGKYLFTPQEASKKLWKNIISLNKWLLGIPISLFIFLGSIIYSKNDIWNKLFITSILLLMVGYFFFYFPGLPWLGPNYYYDAFPIMIILTLRGIYNVYLKKKNAIYAALLIIIPLYIFYYPCFFKKISGDISDRTQELVLFNDILKKNNVHNAVVFIESGEFLLKSPYTILVNNSPFLDDDILTVHDRGGTNISLMLFYPERKFYKFYFIGQEDTSIFYEITPPRPFNQIFEFSGYFNNNTGKKIFIQGKHKFAVYGRKGIDKEGHLLYGPHLWFPKGKYKCIFYIKTNRTTGSDPVVKIDICTDSGSKIVAERIIKRSDFPNNKYIYKFPIIFNLEKPAKIETRVYFYGNADVFVRKIRLSEEI